MMKNVSLHDFGEPALRSNLTTIGLFSNVPKYGTKEDLQIEASTMLLGHYPEVTYDMLATRESARTISAGELFLPVRDSAFKKIAATWREKGLAEAIRVTAAEHPERVSHIVHWIAVRLKSMLDLLEKGTLRYEGLPSCSSDLVADIATTRNWSTALIRCISWHLYCTRLAVATRDDRIRIFSNDIPGVPVLRHSAQKSVYCMSWRPNAGRELAVACHTGVLVWTIELSAASNSLSHATLLKQRNHSPVTSVSWHPQGDLLVSCSPMDLNMIVWDVAKEEGVPLKRVGGGGLCFTRWSLCGSKLLAATSGTVFRVWNCSSANVWSTDRWTVPNGRVAAACFGPNLTLLFASTEDPATIFSLPLEDNLYDVKKSSVFNESKIALPLIDLTKVSFNVDDEDYVVAGGKIVAMDWDPTGKYLAILFQASPVVVLFKTTVGAMSRIMEVKPGCLIKGFQGEVPNCIEFYRNTATEQMICLTIGWSSGRIQHFPIVDDESTVNNRTMTLSNLFPRRNDLCHLNGSFSQ